MRPLLLRELHLRAGARLGVAEGAEVPLDYGDAAGEAGAAGAGGVLIDRSHCGRLGVTGPDRLSFLDGQSSNRLTGLAPGAGVLATFLTGKGKLRGVGVVTIQDGRLGISCDGEAVEVLRSHLAGFVIMDDVAIVDRSPETVEFAVVGPGARRAVEAALAVGLPPSLAPFHYVALETEAGPVDVRVAPRVGSGGYVLEAPAGNGERLWLALAAEARPVGYLAGEVLRVEAGWPRWGAELDDDTIPIEVGLLEAIDYEKGCFTGYEVVARIRTYGHVNRQLVGLRFAGSAPVASGADLTRDGRRIGSVQSSVRSERAGAHLGLAVIRREAAAPGTGLAVAGGGTATVAELPFFPPATVD